ncbi:hypothetical protein BGW38_008167 [Lunasporangiospora selenospora]|uniref:Uncharacterized protein n=1 Tax=Lunasporangiospora selenospora TaxID=979761 RepID=A0A9P6KGM2_9FUNG|nr:hypothetical protein BGW38_008167 [Lunasporangiospora selenospora]
MYQLLYTNNPGRAGLHRLPYNRPIEYPYLRKLNLYRIAGCDSSAYWAWFIAPCSGLQSLMWGGSPGQKFPTDLACATSVQCHEEHTMAGQYWNFWERLEEFIFTGNCAGIEDQCFERVFERQIMAHEQEDKRTHEAGHYHHSWSGQSKTLIKLLVSNSGFGPLALSAFMGMGHHLTIRRLNFLDCKHVSSTMVLDLLTVCPVLESFSADRVLGEDVFKDGRPWVCTKLKRLELFFDMSSPTLLPECLLLYIYGGIPLYDKEDNGNSENCQEAKVQLATRDMVYTRLATLTELEIMLLERRKFVTSLSYPSQPQDVQSAMQEAVHVLHGSLFFMLREGLDKLRTLKRLRYTSVMDEPYLGEPELIWVKEHWPKVVDANDIRYWSYHTVVVRDLLASLIKKSMENNTA